MIEIVRPGGAQGLLNGGRWVYLRHRVTWGHIG